jgi:hypothetical protein
MYGGGRGDINGSVYELFRSFFFWLFLKIFLFENILK